MKLRIKDRIRSFKSLIVAVAVVSLLLVNSTVVAVPNANAQVPASQSSEDSVVQALNLPQKINIGGQEIPTFPFLMGITVGIPALIAILVAIFAEGTGSADSSSKPSSDKDEEKPQFPNSFTGPDGVTYNSMARDIDLSAALEAFGNGQEVVPEGEYSLSPQQMSTLDVVRGRIYSVPPVPGMPEAGFIEVEEVNNQPDGSAIVTVREVGIDSVILDTNGPVSYYGEPDFSGIQDTDTFAYEVVEEETEPVVFARSMDSESGVKPTFDGKKLKFKKKISEDPDENLSIDLAGEIGFEKIAVDFDGGFGHIDKAVAKLEPIVAVSADLNSEIKADIPQKPNHCNPKIESTRSYTVLEKSFPIKIATPAVLFWGNVTPCIDVYATLDAGFKASYAPELKVGTTIEGGYDPERSEPFFLENSNPYIELPDFQSPKTDGSIEGTFGVTTGVDPNLELKFYKVLGINGSLNSQLLADFTLDLGEKVSVKCEVSGKFKPALQGKVGVDSPKIKWRWLKFFLERVLPIVDIEKVFGPWQFCGKDTVEHNENDSKCENPKLDLLETEYGLFGATWYLYAKNNGVPIKRPLNSDVIDNHFDPCADFSYIIVEGSDPENSKPRLQAVLFFAGEHFIQSQETPLVKKVKDVEINGAHATVRYESFPSEYYLDDGVDYTMDYDLSSNGVTEYGEHVYLNDYQRNNRLTTSFDRFPPPGDIIRKMPLGNVSNRPYDYVVDGVNRLVSVNMGSHKLRCDIRGYEGYPIVERIDCDAFEEIFPATDTRSFPKPLNAPNRAFHSQVHMDFSMLSNVYTDSAASSYRIPSVELADEAVTRIGNVLFDTRGDSVKVTDFRKDFELSTSKISQKESERLDRSRWPKDLKPWTF